jgi:hypothetical protein
VVVRRQYPAMMADSLDVPKRDGGLGMGLSLVAQPGALAAPPSDIITPAPRRILVVDDQGDVADVFAALLEKLGQQVQVAYDGETALEIALEQRPQIAILDVAMPGMTGVELAQPLRKQFLPERNDPGRVQWLWAR